MITIEIQIQTYLCKSKSLSKNQVESRLSRAVVGFFFNLLFLCWLFGQPLTIAKASCGEMSRGVERSKEP